MKKILLSAAVALLALGASAQTAQEDVRIYINPGHGSWGPNNRHMATIGHNPISSIDPDTTDFYESNTNLRKGLALLDKLVEYGVPFDRTKNQTNENPARVGAALDLSQNIVMSHVKCGPYPYETVNGVSPDSENEYNRTLSEIASEVEANNFDMFISIHSNAATDGNTVNYLYFAYDSKLLADGGTPKTGMEEEGAAVKATSIEMSRCMWNHRILDRHTKWTHYDYTMTKEDVAAGKGKIGWQGLGVLNHSVPGTLVEGYFHTYQPARHRYMNFDVCRLEGIDYARGIADYYGWEKESYGAIYGVVRDKYNKFADALYAPNAATSDIYKPLNDVVVTLKNSNGDVVATDTTDVNYNGAYVFQGLQPGDYTVEMAHPAYFSDIYANTNATTKPAPLTVTVKAAKTEYPEAFLIDTAWVAPEVVYVNYPDSLADKNFALADEINFAAEYTNQAALEGKTVRRTIVRDNNEYILAFDADNAPYVYVFDTDTKELKKTLGTTAAVGDIYKLSDIAMTADGYLVGINKANQAYGGANNMTAYKWENDENGVPEGELSIWWTNNFAGNWSAGFGGESMIYNGTLEDGKMVYTGTTTASGGNTRIVIASISEGNYLGYMRNNQDGTYMATKYLGNDYQMTLSPRADDQIIFNSATAQPFEIKLATSDTSVPTILAHLSDGILDKASTGESYFKYAGKDLMVAPNVTDGKVDGVKLIDITDGLDNAAVIATNGTTSIDAAEYKSIAANGELALTIDPVSGYTTAAAIELFLTVDGNVSKFTNKGVKQPSYSGVYAYDLNVTEEGTVSFKLNNKSSKVDLVLTPAEGNEEATEEIVINLGSLEAGETTYDVDLNELIGDYNWSVVVANKTVATGDILATMNTWGASSSTYYRGGIAIENNPESDNFATTYLGVGRSKGIFLLDPMYQVKDGAPYWVGKFNTGNASSTFRAALYNDKFYLTDWSDAYPGIWIFDPTNPTAINNIFAGATNDGKGQLTIGGVAVGGGSTGVAFTGSGDDRKMFIYVEDLPTSNGGNKLYRYDIGANDTWGAVAPTQLTAASALLINTNTGMLGSALHNVVFCTQTRNADQNNTSVPAFIVINEAGDIIFNGGDLEGLNGCLGGGMALNADETKFAIVDGSAAIQVYDVEWSDDNVPTFTHATSIATNDQEISQMAFDYAGNLHCINRKHGYYVHSVPGDAKDVTTPAKAELLIKGKKTGVEDVTIEEVDEDAPVEYYNLQGVKVENPSNGIYIKVQGKKSTKVYVK